MRKTVAQVVTTPRRSRGRAILFLLALVLAILPAGASAQQVQPQQPAHPAALPPRRANYSWDVDLLRGSFSYRDVLDSDADLVKKLSSGLSMVIAMRAYVYQEGQDTPVALATRVCRVVYDIWDEVYRIHVSEPSPPPPTPPERDQAVFLDGVFRICTEAKDLAVVKRGLLTAGGSYFLGVVVDVNPVSPQMVQQMQQWMTRPSGSTGIGPADALFGSFVQLFARQIPTSDRTLKFRTQSVVP
jgi:hypothetical protein